ncbi:MAG: haloacid dehalogenase-like hydrolase [Verrucomicrobiota bacterium]|nr:haloacid dehalogenase-like hydrolase [Verrucomicrobiota bacterium]
MTEELSVDCADKRLLLWDIDSTLINSAGAGLKALKGVIARRYSADDDLHDIEIAGRTDAAIARSILQKYAVEPDPATVAAFLDEYLELLEEFLPQLTGHVLPGVREILTRLQNRPDRVLALLTGNLRRGAELKLRRYGLWDYFEFGAFADDHHDRNELGAFARTRAREKHNHDFAITAIDVIGDTGHDIACGKIFGARTIAVATGSWMREQLAAHQPDFLFDDFSDVDAVIATLGW